MKHTIELDDLELTALITHLEGQSEHMVESRLNCSNPSDGKYDSLNYTDSG